MRLDHLVVFARTSADRRLSRRLDGLRRGYDRLMKSAVQRRARIVGQPAVDDAEAAGAEVFGCDDAIERGPRPRDHRASRLDAQAQRSDPELARRSVGAPTHLEEERPEIEVLGTALRHTETAAEDRELRSEAGSDRARDVADRRVDVLEEGRRFEDLRADMRVDSEKRQALGPPQQREGLCEVRFAQTELRVLAGGTDVVVGVRFDSDVDPEHDLAGSTASHRRQALELEEVVDDDHADAPGKRRLELLVGLPAAVEMHSVGREASAFGGVQFPEGAHVECKGRSRKVARQIGKEQRLTGIGYFDAGRLRGVRKQMDRLVEDVAVHDQERRPVTACELVGARTADDERPVDVAPLPVRREVFPIGRLDHGRATIEWRYNRCRSIYRKTGSGIK